MESNWAAEHLQVIRTLMERAAIYRRALAPIMLATGIIGAVAGPLGWFLELDTSRSFGLYWGGISVAGLAVAFGLIRRQAWRDSEPLWSPPTRRVTQAMVPPMSAGLVTVLILFLPRWSDPLQSWWLPGIWMVLYGCAVHAAGFFMPRGMKLFGGAFILAGCSLLLGLSLRGGVPSLRAAHWIMGAVFGGFHLAYGLYLYLTKEGKTVA